MSEKKPAAKKAAAKKPAAKKPRPTPAAQSAAPKPVPSLADLERVAGSSPHTAAPKANAAGWVFHPHAKDGVIGQKRFDLGVTQREVHGKDLAEAKALADVIDNQVAQRENGRMQAAAREADELRARAKALEGK